MVGSEDPMGSIGHALYGLHLGMRTKRGKPHALELLESWCRRSGLSAVELFTASKPFGGGALVAKRPSEIPVDAGEMPASGLE